MPWIKGECTGADEALALIKNFMTRTRTANAPSACVGTGDGVLVGSCATHLASVGSYKLTILTVDGSGNATFKVEDPSLVRLLDGESHAPYSDEISLTLVKGATDFVAGDYFTIGVIASTAKWVMLQDETAADDHYFIAQGEGSSGDEEILIGIMSAGEVQPYLRPRGWTGYDSLHDFDAGHIGESRHITNIPLTAGAMNYWIWDYDDCVKFVFRCGSVDEHGYLGFPVRLCSPSQFDYPLMICGTSLYGDYTIADEKYHRAYWHSHDTVTAENFQTMLYGEMWHPNAASQVCSYPLGCNVSQAWARLDLVHRNHDGTVPMFPAAVVFHTLSFIYGYYHGLYHVGTEEGLLTSDDIIIQDGAAFTCFQDTFDGDYICAMKME